MTDAVVLTPQELLRPAAPSSPEETKMLCPCDAAFLNIGSMVF